jgi:hypothetical protein
MRSATAVHRRLDRHDHRRLRPEHRARRLLRALRHPRLAVRRALPAVRLALLLEPALPRARHRRY